MWKAGSSSSVTVEFPDETLNCFGDFLNVMAFVKRTCMSLPYLDLTS